MTQSSITNGTNYAARAQVKINNVNAVAMITPDAFDKVTMELLNPLANGTYTVVVSDLRDFAGFKMESKTFTMNVSDDGKAPVITSAKALERDLFEIKFDKALNSTSGLGTLVLGATSTNTNDNTTIDLYLKLTHH